MAYLPPPSAPYVPYDQLARDNPSVVYDSSDDDGPDGFVEGAFTATVELKESGPTLGETNPFPDPIGRDIILSDHQKRVQLRIPIAQRGKYKNAKAWVVKGRIDLPKGYTDARLKIQFYKVGRNRPGVAQIAPRNFVFDDYSPAKVTKNLHSELGVDYGVKAGVGQSKTVELNKPRRPRITGRAEGRPGTAIDTIEFSLAGNEAESSQMPTWMEFAFVVRAGRRFGAEFVLKVKMKSVWISNIERAVYWECNRKRQFGDELEWLETLEGKDTEGLLLDKLVSN